MAASKRIIRRQPAPAAAPPIVDEEVPGEYDASPMTNGGGFPGGSDVPEDGDDIRGGWGASQETIDSTSNYAQAFRPGKDTQIIRFLSGKPYASFRRHWIERVGLGKRAYTCYKSVGKECPICLIGDKPGAVTAFNVALCSDDGEAVVKSWECGVKITQQLKTYANDPKIGPLDRPGLYFAVSKSEATQRQQVTTMVNPVRERDLLEDWATPPIDPAQIPKLMENCYTADIVDIPTRQVMDEVAAEFAGSAPEEQQRGWGG